MIFKKIKNFLRVVYNFLIKIYLIKKSSAKHSIALEKVKLNVHDSKKINVVFLVIRETTWKYDMLFNLMQEHESFCPQIVICPYLNEGGIRTKLDSERAYAFFNKLGYSVINSWNEETNTWLDIKNELNPDIVFFTNPWPLTRKEYLITNFTDTLTCYVPYGFKNSNLFKAHFDQLTQNLVWKFFIETNYHKELAQKYAANKGANVVVTGYPGMDRLIDKRHNPVDVWKKQPKSKKKIIWAPHHTIPGYGANLDYSTFLSYASFMLSMAEKYQNEIQIAFKPHPILRSKLSLENVWGKEKADNYYEKWNQIENGQVNESDYIDLFLTSDAMIHDSGSFVLEYLYVHKPVMFLINDQSVFNKFNELGKNAISSIEKGFNENDIENFIKAVINDLDVNKELRSQFFKENINLDEIPSKAIFEIIKKSINLK